LIKKGGRRIKRKTGLKSLFKRREAMITALPKRRRGARGKRWGRSPFKNGVDSQAEKSGSGKTTSNYGSDVLSFRYAG